MVLSCHSYLVSYPGTGRISSAPQPPACPPINDALTDDCLLSLFRRFPLRPLLTLSHTCARWNRLLAESRRSRRSLILLLGSDPACLIGDPDLSPSLDSLVGGDGRPMFSMKPGLLAYSALSFRTLTPGIVLSLLEGLPKITSLEVAINEISSVVLEQLIPLLRDGWGHQLVTLKISADFKEPDSERYVDVTISYHLQRLLAVLTPANLPKLKNLTCHLWKHVLPSEETWRLMFTGGRLARDVGPRRLPKRPSINLPLLAQLEQLYFYSLDPAEGLLDSLLRYAPGNRALKSLHIPNPISTDSTLAAYLSLPLDTAKIQFLGLYQFDLKRSRLLAFSGRFTSLTSLWLYVSPDSFSGMMLALSGLGQLAYLQLSMHFLDQFPGQARWARGRARAARRAQGGDDAEDEEDEDDREEDDAALLGKYSPAKDGALSPPTLSTVKALYIRLRTNAHTDHYGLPIGAHFPGLEVLELDNPSRKCTLCGHDGRVDGEDATSARLREACLLSMATPFAGLSVHVPLSPDPNLVVVKYI